MRRLIALATLLLLAGCGSEPAPRPAAAKPANPYAVYSDGVRAFYGDAPVVSDGDPETDVEIEYHQPPKPAETSVGQTITLTGTNIGVRMEVRVERVRTVGSQVAVDLALHNTGIAVYEGPLASATLDGRAATAGAGECTLAEGVRIDVGQRATGCLLFDAGDAPRKLQLALEAVPADAGGIWDVS